MQKATVSGGSHMTGVVVAVHIVMIPYWRGGHKVTLQSYRYDIRFYKDGDYKVIPFFEDELS
jgi:hypothetical protein